MNGLKIYKPADIEKLISTRHGEVKFGENLKFVKSIDELDKSSANYVLLGIQEDIGVRANYGNSGTSRAWNAALKALVNIQVNKFNNPENLILLGELNCEDLMAKASNIDKADPNYYPKLGDLVKQIDQLLANIIEKIISTNKIPIVIGGGHNNAYGNIKGSSKALNDPINVVNIDAHTDLRQLEHRHSGNGFSYAIEGQYLRKYTVFGLHKNYTPEYIFEEMNASENFQYHIAEDILKNPQEVNNKFQQSLESIGQSKFGLELDCDSISDFPSSAKSPVGFSVNNIRSFIKISSENENCCYFHICEASPNEQNDTQVGKALAYFVSDFLN
ncbi:formimidoylglutamase [Christiangramia forsetii]|uniref:Formimidoylglutamase n=2 Tax=Christiangramia forsetii TaxID=411153 RepID=A0LZD9_CHRFK|nr:formimidoylglutamase [Christiangramia forsetii]GGG38080.1 arginase [Christiangramia forsetii]CAL65734.1 formimidoylglutamase [Christiangramia forsetii KT0803]